MHDPYDDHDDPEPDAGSGDEQGVRLRLDDDTNVALHDVTPSAVAAAAAAAAAPVARLVLNQATVSSCRRRVTILIRVELVW